MLKMDIFETETRHEEKVTAALGSLQNARYSNGFCTAFQLKLTLLFLSYAEMTFTSF